MGLNPQFRLYLTVVSICLDGLYKDLSTAIIEKSAANSQEEGEPAKLRINYGKGLYDQEDAQIILANRICGTESRTVFSIEITSENSVTVRLSKGTGSNVKRLISNALKNVKITWIEGCDLSTH